MNTAQLADIRIYPIKSIQGIPLQQSLVTEMGLEFDRRLVITDLHGKFITGRTKAKLVLVRAVLNDNGLAIYAPDMPELQIDYNAFSPQHQSVQVWQDTINAQHCSQQIDAWFSQFLNTACNVYYYSQQSKRQIASYQQQVSFADGYPLLLTSSASLQDLNNKVDGFIDMAQFRPNIVVEHCQAFAEDTWRNIAIGEVEFLLAKPCSRCIFTTVNHLTGQRSSNKEPLNTLQKYRMAPDKQIYFGQNLIPLNSGMIHIGDKLEILKYQ